MENKKWQTIWNNRNLVDLEEKKEAKEKMNALLSMDGFDSGTGSIQADNFSLFTENLIQRFQMKNNESVFEIGSGAGAFLFPFYLYGMKVGGIDYSSVLINAARKLFQSDDFQLQDALELDENTKYDYVVAFSVFFYFPNYEYANVVLEKMYRKARKGILILDVPNLQTKSECEIMRRGTMDALEYAIKYDGLNHLYYNMDFFLKFAEQNKIQEIIIQRQNIRNYINNDFRFNCFLLK
jgi:ubiquinone/menaquinone biosynthesis C-methylase UbiE